MNFFYYAVLLCIAGYAVFMAILNVKLDRKLQRYKDALEIYGTKLANAITAVYAQEGQIIGDMAIRFDDKDRDAPPKVYIKFVDDINNIDE
jgi:hypothetical protein